MQFVECKICCRIVDNFEFFLQNFVCVCVFFLSLLQSLQFRRRGIFGRIVGKDFVVEFCVIFEFVAIFAVQKKRNLLQIFFVILSLLHFFAVQKKRNLLQNFIFLLF